MKDNLNTISILASIVTVINFGLSLALSFEGLSFDVFPAITSSFETKPLLLRIIMFLFLEVLISLVFVKIYLFIHKMDEGSNPMMLVFKTILLMCSAWTSLFNVRWLLLNYINDVGAWVVALILASLIANFIWTYWYAYETKDKEAVKLKPNAIFFIHAVFMGLVFTILILDKSF